MENENQMEQLNEESAEPIVEQPAEEAAQQTEEAALETIAETPAAPKKNNALIIAIAAVLGLVLFGLLGLAVIAGTDGIAGFEGIKSKMDGWFDGDKAEEQPAPATEPAGEEPEATEALPSYTVDAAKAPAIVNNKVATIGSNTLTNGLLQVYYQTGMLNFYSQYGMYLMYMGVDFSQPLDQQVYDPNTNMTWQEFLLDSALQNWQLFTAMRDFATKNEEFHYAFSEEELEYVNNLSGRIQEMTEASGYTDPEEFVKAQIGVTATVDGLKQYMEDEYFYVSYYAHLQEKLAPTMEQIELYFVENQASLESSGVTKEAEDVVDVRHILIMPEGGTTDENGNTTYSEEEWEAARVKAQELLDQWKNGEATEEAFSKLANEHTTDPGSQSTGGLYSGVTQGQMVPEFNDWIFDESRQMGDTDLVKTSYGYHIMYFVKREAGWIHTCRTYCLNDSINALIESVLAQYPLDVDYESIGLSN